MNNRCFHFLHIDDDQSDAFFVERALKQCSREIALHWVSSGQLALDYLNEDSNPAPHLIICDVKMPGMSGFEVIKCVRSSERHRRTPIVMFSGSVMIADVQMALDLGANAYIGKPGSPGELLKTVTGIAEFWCEACVLPAAQTQKALPANVQDEVAAF